MTPLVLLALAVPGRAAELSGRVVDARGEPVSGATVQAFDVLLEATEAETDADGRWSLAGLPAGTWRVRAVPSWRRNLVARWAPDAATFCESTGLTVASGDARGDVDLVLPDGAEVSGRLLDSAGRGVAGAPVYAVGADEATDPLLDRAALTDVDGGFVVRGLDAPATGAGRWLLLTDVDGWPKQYLGGAYDDEAGEVVDVAAQARVEVGAWPLLDGILVTGTVRGPGGAVADATVHVYASSQVVTVRTDADGRYEAVGLPPGDVLPWVSTDGLALTYFPNHDRPTAYAGTVPEGGVLDGADLEAPVEARLLVDLVSDETGAPLGGVSALLYNSDQTVGRGNLADADGRLVIDRLHGGAYKLYVWGERGGSADDWVRDDGGQPQVLALEGAVDNGPVELRLPAAALVEGIVRTEDGSPLVGATVVLRRTSDGEAAATGTDRDGRFALGGLPAGTWTAEALLSPLCPGDPGAVTVYLGETVNPDWQATLELDIGDTVEALEFTLPMDADRDGMGDAWEARWGLDPTRDDGAEDPDRDTYTNRVEYLLDTNPVEAPAEDCGCRGAGGAAAALLLAPLAFLRRRRA